MALVITGGVSWSTGINIVSETSPPIGQVAYTTPGTYSWTAPAGVTSVSVVAIGGGGGFSQISASLSPYTGHGGGGGGLGWKNNIAVTPGQSYTVVVGAAGGNPAGTNMSLASNGTNGGDSYFINATTVKGGGGVAGEAQPTIGRKCSSKRRISSRIPDTSSGSSADVTSSNNITFGFKANARAIATRCFCPPDRRSGY